jgi:hypothetical protein
METRNVSFRNTVCARRLAAFVACFSLRYPKKYLALLAAFVAAIFSHAALAQAPPEVWVPGYNANGSKTYYSTSNLTVAQAQRSAPIWELLPNGASGAKVTMTSELAFGATKVPVIAKAVATGAAVFGTFKAIMGGPVGIGVTALMAVPAVIDWLNQGGIRASPSGSDTQFQRKPSPDGCGSPIGDGLSIINAAGDTSSGCYGQYGGVSIQLDGISKSGNQCVVSFHCSNGTHFGSQASWSADSGVSPWQSATIDQIGVDMEKVPVTIPLIKAILDAGGSLPIAYAPGGTTGPSSAPGVPVTKSTVIPAEPPRTSSTTVSGNPFGLVNGTPTVTGSGTSSRNSTVDGATFSIPTSSKSTSTYNSTTNNTTTVTNVTSDPHTVTTVVTPKTDLTYAPGEVTGTSSSSSTTTVTNNITNNVVNTTTSSENKPAEQPKDEQKDPCKENPDRVGCMEADTPEGKIPRHQEDITYTPQNVLGEGSCPADLTASLATLGRSVTVWDWQKTCELSLPLRAIVMSLASFAALMIVMPGAGKS